MIWSWFSLKSTLIEIFYLNLGKRNDFNHLILRLPFRNNILCVIIWCSCYAHACSHYADFIHSDKVSLLTHKLLQQSYDEEQLKSTQNNLKGHHHELVDQTHKLHRFRVLDPKIYILLSDILFHRLSPLPNFGIFTWWKCGWRVIHAQQENLTILTHFIVCMHFPRFYFSHLIRLFLRG